MNQKLSSMNVCVLLEGMNMNILRSIAELCVGLGCFKQTKRGTTTLKCALKQAILFFY